MFARPLVAALALLLASCSSIDPRVYRGEKPALDLQRYFNGTLEGHGMFQDRSGQVQRRFVVTIKASWAGDVGTLDEDFLWSDGKRERRVWTLRKATGDATGTRWVGTAADVIGEARGVVSGNTLTLVVPFSTNVTNLIATFTLSPDATLSIGAVPQVSGFTANNFTNPIEYTCTAEDGSFDYFTITVIKAPVETGKSITAFSFNSLTPAVTGTINQVTHTIAVSVPFPTNITNLVATFTVKGLAFSQI